ncbi:MAG: hypothetical protein GQ535_13715 [Rhodobacteraceae bacterium]|nr:hypothetical protein [Paracoccaceae bacterium]
MTKTYPPADPLKKTLAGASIAAVLLFGISVPAANAHEAGAEYDRFESAVQCAGLWLGDFAALTTLAKNSDEFDDSQQSYEMGMTFRRVAIEADEGSLEKIDFLILGWTQYFSRLATEAGGSWQYPPVNDGSQKQWAGEQFVLHQRYCQGFGLALEDKWGFH